MPEEDRRFPVERIADQIRGCITSGQYRPGDRLPRLKDIATTHGTSIKTAHKAIMRLRAEGLVTTYSGTGAHVRDPRSNDRERLTRIAELLEPCRFPIVRAGQALCQRHRGARWPCLITQAAWLARGLDPEDEAARVLTKLRVKTA